jgi:hypothetical protein
MPAMNPPQEDRWDGLRLWVYRTRLGGMPCAVIMRRTSGGRQHDTLLGRANLPEVLADMGREDPYVALLGALVQLRGAVIVHNQLRAILAARPSGVPLGTTGGPPSP